jgi:nitroreductase
MHDRPGRYGTLGPMPELHRLLAGRWSPRGFDDRYELRPAELASLLEAARSAPSDGNAQPWRFVLGRRDDACYKRMFCALADADQRWAGRASALLTAAYTTAYGPGAAAAYDLGQAMAHLGVQAVALGLHTRQIITFDVQRLHGELGLPRDVVPHAVVAVGRLGDPETLPADLRGREFRLRTRRPIVDLVLSPGR